MLLTSGVLSVRSMRTAASDVSTSPTDSTRRTSYRRSSSSTCLYRRSARSCSVARIVAACCHAGRRPRRPLEAVNRTPCLSTRCPLPETYSYALPELLRSRGEVLPIPAAVPPPVPPPQQQQTVHSIVGYVP